MWGFTMEILGPSLQEVFARCKQLSLRTVLFIGLKLLDILEEIHNRGIIHRDIKPANILVGD